MSRTKNWRTGLAVLAATGMVVVGVDYASYATTGHSLILGKDNSANRTTTIARTGRGPALALDGRSALLKLSNTKKIAKLNADLVDGKDSAQLAPTTKQIRLGTTGATINGTIAKLVTLPAGTYQGSLMGFMTPSAPATMYCFAADWTRYQLSDPSSIFIAEQKNDASGFTGFQSTNTFKVVSGHPTVVACVGDSATDLTIAPVFNFRPVNGISKLRGTVVPTPKALHPLR